MWPALFLKGFKYSKSFKLRTVAEVAEVAEVARELRDASCRQDEGCKLRES